MTKSLLDEQGYKIQEKSKDRFRLANGEKHASLGKSIIDIEIGGWTIPIEVEIIDSKGRELLLGTPMLNELEAVLDFGTKEMILIIDKEETRIPISCQKAHTKQNNDEIIEESDEYEETDEELETFTTLESNEQDKQDENNEQQKNDQVLAHE